MNIKVEMITWEFRKV